MAEATKTKTTLYLYLPDECWENIVKFLVDDQLSLESLSLVSKQLLFITNRFKFSLTICDETLKPKSLLHRLFRRFPNITSLNLPCFRNLFDQDSYKLSALLCEISEDPFLQLKSLKISIPSRIPAKGLQALSKKHKTSLKSLICSNVVSLNHVDLQNIPKCFPFLEELHLSLVDRTDKYFNRHRGERRFNPGIMDLSRALPNLRKLNLSGNKDMVNCSLLCLFQNCVFLEEFVMFSSKSFTSDGGIASAIRERPNLKSFKFSYMQLMDNSQLINSLVSLGDLNCLDMSYSRISNGMLSSITKEVLPWRKLVLTESNPRVRLLGMNFQVPKLEVLDMSNSSIDDETLYVISKSCSGLLELKLKLCDVTEIGVRLVIENCTKLRKINLLSCHKVAADVFAWMVNSRPSLKHILAPLHFRPSHNEVKPLSKYGCLIGYDKA